MPDGERVLRLSHERAVSGPDTKGGVTHPPANTSLARLARLGAQQLHVWAGMKPKDGHDREPFTACAHPDCQLVRGDEL